ncbi:MAG: hypothetical protein FWE16_01740 [Firmicutes bacterium]|nr:hypothetical protein [Bacillota bacterium]
MTLKPTKQFQFEDLEPWEQDLLQDEIVKPYKRDEKACGEGDASSLREFDDVYGNQLIDNYAKKTKLKECRWRGRCITDNSENTKERCFWETREQGE